MGLFIFLCLNLCQASSSSDEWHGKNSLKFTSCSGLTVVERQALIDKRDNYNWEYHELTFYGTDVFDPERNPKSQFFRRISVTIPLMARNLGEKICKTVSLRTCCLTELVLKGEYSMKTSHGVFPLGFWDNFAVAFQSNTSVQALDLSHNNFTRPQLEKIGQALCLKRNLEKLSFNDCLLLEESGDLRYTEHRDGEAFSVVAAQILNANPTLKVLGLANLGMGESAMLRVINTHHKGLKRLDLTGWFWPGWTMRYDAVKRIGQAAKGKVDCLMITSHVWMCDNMKPFDVESYDPMNVLRFDSIFVGSFFSVILFFVYLFV